MADKVARDLPYGHFGRARYSTDEEKWLLERHPSCNTSIRPLTQAKTVLPPSSGDGHHALPSREPRGHRQRQDLKAVLDAFPELQPAAATLRRMVSVSEAVQKVASRQDSAKGKLIAFSSVYSKTAHRPIMIAALPTGESGTDLKLVQAPVQRRGFGDDMNVWLEVPTLKGEESIWIGGGAPIQQIVFAQNLNGTDPLLAVRRATDSLVFRPVHRGRYHEDTSAISPNLLATIDTSYTESEVHMDLAFNAWFPQQLGIIDRTGHWTVLEFESRNMNRVARSWTSRNLAGKDSNFSIFQDGWGRITWILDALTVAVCTRASWRLYSIENDVPSLLKDSPIEGTGHGSWILDFILLPDRMDCLCIVTTSHLLVYQVSRSSLQKADADLKLRIRHFRSPEDISLRITGGADDQGIYVILRSSITSLCSLYRIGLNDDGQLIHEDPVQASILPETSYGGSSIADLHVASAKLQLKPSLDSKPHVASTMRNSRYFNATVLLQSLSVLENLLIQPPAGKDVSAPAPMWEGKITATSSRLLLSDFVVGEDDDADGGEIARPHPVSRRARRPPRVRGPDAKAIDLTRVGETLLAPVGKPQVIEELFNAAISAASSADANTLLPIQTLISLSTGELDINDIDQVEDTLRKLADVGSNNIAQDSQDGAESRVKILTSEIAMASLSIPDLPTDKSLHQAYNRIVSEWIGSLPEQVSGRIRLAKVALSRQIATNITLANRLLLIDASSSSTQGTQPHFEDHGPMSLSWNLPVRRSAMIKSSATQSRTIEFQAERSTLPTPSPTATPSVTTASSYPSSFAAPELYRLSKYATFSKPAPSVLPRPLTKVLSHWEIGADPKEYDWLSTSKRIMRREEEEIDQDLTEKERRRLQRRAERHIQRQRKEVAASQAQQLASSQAPEILTASQPTPRKVESQPVLGSSQTTAMPFASQVVPGRFGGRPPPKKKRKSGF